MEIEIRRGDDSEHGIEERSEHLEAFLKPGVLLHASCSQQIYGELKELNYFDGVGYLADILVYDVTDLIPCSESYNSFKAPEVIPEVNCKVLITCIPVEWFHKDSIANFNTTSEDNLCLVDVSEPGQRPKTRTVGYFTGAMAAFSTPGDGCYRCTRCFSIVRPLESNKESK